MGLVDISITDTDKTIRGIQSFFESGTNGKKLIDFNHLNFLPDINKNLAFSEFMKNAYDLDCINYEGHRFKPGITKEKMDNFLRLLNSLTDENY